MARIGASRSLPLLAGLIAVLIVAGGFAAATVDGGNQPPAGSSRVGATGFSQDLLVDEVTGAAPASAPEPALTTSTTAAPRTGSVPTLPTPPSTTRVTNPQPPGFVPPPLPTVAPTTTIKGAPPVSTWSKTANGMSVRMHIEPAVPVAGQPVRFVIDELTAPPGCCIVHLSPDVGRTIPLGTPCGDDASRAGLSHSHTYAEAGVQAFLLMVLTTSCPDGQGAGQPTLGLDLVRCITVGPDAARSTRPVPPVCGG